MEKASGTIERKVPFPFYELAEKERFAMRIKNVPMWIGILFSIVMLVGELTTAQDIFLYGINIGIVYTLAYIAIKIGRVEQKIKEIDKKLP